MNLLKRILIFPLLLILLTACSGPKAEIGPRFSFIEVVEDKEHAVLHEIEDIDIILEDSEVIVGNEEMLEKYPRFELVQIPAYIIFENTGVLTKDMVMWTYDLEEAVFYLEDMVEEYKEAMEKQ